MTALLPGPHHPERPGWDCSCCAMPYPCPRGRQLMRQAHGPAVATVAAGLLDAAAAELDASPAELFARFIAWTAPSLPWCPPRARAEAGHRPSADAPVSPRTALAPAGGVIPGRCRPPGRP
jgi:hypothetical protein